MYARVANALSAGATRVTAAYLNSSSSSSSSNSTNNSSVLKPLTPAPRPVEVEIFYTLQNGTLTTSTWPLTSMPVTVTATSVVLSHHSSTDTTPSVLTHPLRTSATKGPMWQAASTHLQRGYAVGHMDVAEGVPASNSEAEASTSQPSASATGTKTVNKEAKDAAALSSTSATRAMEGQNTATKASAASTSTSAPANDTAQTVATAGEVPKPLGTVMLPDALVFSFRGNPEEFQDRLRGANVLVFFYKAACIPCAEIRSKLIHAVTDHLPIDAAGIGHRSGGAGGGANGLTGPKASATAPAGGDDTEKATSSEAAQTPPGGAARSASQPNFGPEPDAAFEMTPEDQKACALVYSSLGDVAKAFPRKIIFLTVDTNENPRLTALHDIRSLPTFFAYRNGRMMRRVEGTQEDEVKHLIETLTAEEG